MPRIIQEPNRIPVPDADTTFSGGVVSFARASILAPGQVSLLINAEIGRAGELVTRRGTTQLAACPLPAPGPVQGLCWYDSISAGKYLVGWIGGRAWRLVGGAWTQLGAGWTSLAGPGGQIHGVQGVDKIYWVDGVTGTSVWDGANVTVEGTQGNSTAPACALLAWHTSCLIEAGQTVVPDGLYYSYTLDGTTWDRALRQIRVGAGDGDPITAIVPWADNTLMVFKRRSVWSVYDNPSNQPADFTIQSVHRALGCVAARSAVQCGADVWFLADRGVHSVKRTEGQLNTQEVTDPISAPIQDVIDRINPGARAGACAAYYANRYFLAVPLDGATQNNAVLVYNFLSQSWSGYWLGWSPTCFVVTAPGGHQRLWFGDSVGNLFEWLDYIPEAQANDVAYQDAGAPIATTILTRAYVFGDTRSPKTGFSVELEFADSDATANVVPIVDGVNTPSISVTGAAGTPQTFPTIPAFDTFPARLTFPLSLPLSLPARPVLRPSFDLMALRRWREIQYLITSAAHRLRLRMIQSLAWVDVYAIQSAVGLGSLSRPAGQIQWATSPVPTTDTAGTVTLTVARVNGSYGAVGVSFATADGTAKNLVDYFSQTGQLAWADGDSSTKSISIQLQPTNAGAVRQFLANLAIPTGGAILGNPAQAAVNITSQAPAPLGTYLIDTSGIVLGTADRLMVSFIYGSSFTSSTGTTPREYSYFYAPTATPVSPPSGSGYNGSQFLYNPGQLIDVSADMALMSSPNSLNTNGRGGGFGISVVIATTVPPSAQYPNGSLLQTPVNLLITGQSAGAGVAANALVVAAASPGNGSDVNQPLLLPVYAPAPSGWPYLFLPAPTIPTYRSVTIKPSRQSTGY